MTAIPARVAGVGEVIVASPRPHPAVFAAALEAGVDRSFRSAARTPLPRSPMARPRCRGWTRSSAPATAGSRPRRRSSPATARSTSTRGPPRSSSSPRRPRRVDRRGSHRAGRARSRRARGVDHAKQAAGAARSRRGGRQMPAEGPASASLAAHGAIIVTRACAKRWHSPTRQRPSISSSIRNRWPRARTAGAVFVGPWTAQVAGDYAIGSNHVLPTAGAARFRGGLNAADFVRLVSVQRCHTRRPGANRADGDDAGARRGPGRPCRVDRESELPLKRPVFRPADRTSQSDPIRRDD